MADHDTHQSAIPSTSKSRSNQHSDVVELEYPQLLLEASLPSLLQHSQSLDTHAVTNMSSQPNNPLSDSWASISDIEYTQDDDLQSETTDTGSLIDASSVQDVHSVNDSGEISECDDTDDFLSNNDMSESRLSTSSESLGGAVRQPTPWSSLLRDSTDTVIVDEPQKASDSLAQPASADRDRSITSSLFSQGKSTTSSLVAGVSQPMSSLDLSNRPVHLLLLKTKSVTADSQAAVLSKIGAALVADGQPYMKSSNYHIIPSTFGPGTHPDTSELIPVTKQMTIHEALIPPSIDLPCNFKSSDNSLITCSQGGILITYPTGTQQEPDIILSMVNQKDTDHKSQATHRVMRLLTHIHHGILHLQDRSSHVSSQSLDQARITFSTQTEVIHSLPPSILLEQSIDVSHFLAFESGELKQRLNVLTENECRRRTASPRAKDHVNTVQPFRLQQSGVDQNNADKGAVMWWPTAYLSTISEYVNALPGVTVFDAAHNNAQRFWNWLTPLRGGGLIIVLGLLQFVFAMLRDTSWEGYGIRTIDAPMPYARHCNRGSWMSSTMGNSLTKISNHDSAATSLSKTTDISLLSGVLHEVAEYWPLPRLIHSLETFPTRPSQDQTITHQGKECGVLATFVQLHRGTTLTIPEQFYQDEQPVFTTIITRGRHTVPHRMESLKYGRQAIKIDGGEVKGLLKILISTSRPSVSRICALVDVRNTSIEHLFGIVDQRREAGGNDIEMNTTGYTLLRLKRESSQRWPALEKASDAATRTIEAAHTAIEDVLASQYVACYHKSDQCWFHKAKYHEGQVTALARGCKNKLMVGLQKMSGRAGLLASQAAAYTVDMVPIMKLPARDLSLWLKDTREKLAAVLTTNAAKAQGRARQILRSQG